MSFEAGGWFCSYISEQRSGPYVLGYFSNYPNVNSTYYIFFPLSYSAYVCLELIEFIVSEKVKLK